MNRKEEHQKILNTMSPIEKIERTKRENLRKRGVIVEEYSRWIICYNEMPFTDRGDTQYVVWYRYPNRIPTGIDFAFFHEVIRKKYNNLTLLHNSIRMMSVQDRFHYHLFN